MIARLLTRRRKPSAKFTPVVPEGERLYAIGDIHGRDDLLAELLETIEADDRARGGAASRLVFLGDLIDRGPQSAHVVERVMNIAEARPDTVCLTGNHEEVFLRALTGDLKALKFFTRIGGTETILSYGIPEDSYRRTSFEELHALLIEAVPERHVAFLERFEDLVTIGDYVFVHAGIRPGVALTEQRRSDLRWIRDEFLDGAHDELDKMIVHGHTIFPEVEYGANRIGLDTGAYVSGRLTAMGFEGADRWVLQTG